LQEEELGGNEGIDVVLGRRPMFTMAVEARTRAVSKNNWRSFMIVNETDNQVD
jgi:hypothetical protein